MLIINTNLYTLYIYILTYDSFMMPEAAVTSCMNNQGEFMDGIEPIKSH